MERVDDAWKLLLALRQDKLSASHATRMKRRRLIGRKGLEWEN